MGSCCRELGAIGDIARAAAPIVASVYLGPAAGGMFGTSAAIGSAIVGAGVGGLSAAMQGGNILRGAMINGIGGFVAGGGLTDASSWLDKFSEGTAPGNMAGGVTETAASNAAQQAGITTNASDFLNAGTQAGTSATDSVINGALQQPATASTQFGLNEVAGYSRGAANAVQQGNTGLIGRIGQWASDNPVPALMAGQTVMAGIGGMAQAQANAEQAQANRDMNMQLHTVHGGFSNPGAATVRDPNLATDMAGRYIRGPLAGKYAPGRAPGLLNTVRA